jgi:cell division protease FtsH
MGGRSAEELVFGFATTGAQDDLQKATEIARRMVMEFGMSEKVGPINIAEPGPQFLSPVFRRGEDISEETEVAIDREVRSILIEGQEKARGILERHRRDLDELARVLLERETLDRNDLERYFSTGDPDVILPIDGVEPGQPVRTERTGGNREASVVHVAPSSLDPNTSPEVAPK